MIGLDLTDTLDGVGDFTSLGELLVEFDEVLKPLEVVSELDGLRFHIHHLHIVASLAVSTAVRTTDG